MTECAVRWLAVLGMVVVLGAACDTGTPGGGGDGQTTHAVRYQVSGVSKASLTYSNQGGDTEQASDATLPWSYDFTAESGAFLYISAQNSGASGSITCTIYVDGQDVKHSTSTGGYSICQASGTL